MKALLTMVGILCMLCSHAAEGEGKEPPAFIREIVAIKIPKIAAKDATLPELIDFVSHRIVELDPHKPGGISILTSGFNEEGDKEEDKPAKPKASGRKVDYAAENVRVDQVFTELARLFEVEFHITSVGVVVTPSGGKPFPNPKAKEGEVYFTYKKKAG